MNDPIGLGALNPRQQVGHDGLTMGILQKVTRVRDRVEGGIHARGPSSAPTFGKHVVSTTPNEVRGQGPIQQGAIVQGLRCRIAIVKTVEGDRSRETTIAIKRLIWQASIRRRKTPVNAARLTRQGRRLAAEERWKNNVRRRKPGTEHQ